MQFLYLPLTWGFLLVLLPLLIHLINLMRHRRVAWAAMDFLLASYRKHRRWVWLKQLLLLLLRMLAVAAAVAMLAKLMTQDPLGRLFGEQTTHHYVLLDDSLSMADRTGNGSAFDRGRQTIAQLAATAQNGNPNQLVTLIRFSEASRAAQRGTLSADFADLTAVPVNGKLADLWDEQQRSLRVSQLAVDAEPALELAEQMMQDAPEQRRILHLVSDFRQADWKQPTAIRERLARLAKNRVEINLVRCVEVASPNLVVTRLAPEVGTQAAGVPLLMTVAVKNFGTLAADRILLKARSKSHPTNPQGTESAPQATELPDVLIERIEPGETVTRQFQVFFPTPGPQEVEVELPVDSVTEDNHRWCVVDLPAGESALIVDGNSDESSAYYLESIFRPGSKAKTGVIPTVQPLNYLRDATVEELSRHQAIYLLDVPPLDNRTLENLRQYVERGGGLAIFAGPNLNTTWSNNWYEAGVYPSPLERVATYDPEPGSAAADVQFTDHPIFAAFAGERNPFAAAIRIRQYAATPRRWTIPADSGIEVLARLPDGSPLVVERGVGAGRVVAFLTTLGPQWNNWALEPSLIVVVLQLHAHLAQPQRPRADRQVGESIVFQLNGTEYQPDLKFQVPGDDSAPRELEKTARASESEGGILLTASLGPNSASAGQSETDYSGIYEAQLETRDGRIHVRRFALNVDPRESDLATTDRVALRQALEPVPIRVYSAGDQVDSLGAPDRNAWSELLLWVLIAVLVVEQWLAYRLSYHPYALQPAGGIS